VQEAIELLHYRPNHLARSLVAQTSRTIGVVVADLTAHPYPQAIKAIQDAARQHGYQVLVADTDRSPAREQETLAMLRERRVDGVVIVSASGQGPSDHIAALADEGFPFVLINRFVDNPAWPAIVIDNIQGVKEAVKHLVSLGHRRIAFLSMPVSPPNLTKAGLERLEGFQRGLAEAGLPLEEGWVRIVNLGAEGQFKGGYEAALAWLGESPAHRPTAIVTSGDHMALGVVRAAHALGLRVPGDISVVGHDDVPTACFVTPALTTVEQPMRAAGAAAVEVLLRCIGGETVIGNRLPGRLVVRDSTGAAPPG
jgi:DNA-binding LacI/PurR family transcriptional regulator